MSISNCGHDEHGKYHGGSAGDQTGTEYRVIAWYNRPWNHVIRPKDRAFGIRLALIARQAAENNNIGYDQYQRKTYYNALKAAKWEPLNVKTKCETDCSASTVANVVAAGYQLGIKAVQNLSPDLYTGNIRKALIGTGQFEDLTASKYLTSDQYLLPGDILLYEGHHVAINLSTGTKVANTAHVGTTSTGKQKYTGTFPSIPLRGYFKSGDRGTQVGYLQRFLNWYGGYGLKIDYIVGPKTIAAVKKFQKAEGLTVDGQFGPKSLAAAKAVKK